MEHTSNKQKVVVVGAGPVGALAALYAAKRDDDVHIYELRGDLRDPSTTPLNFTKSINLALSERGINSMREAKCKGLVEAVLEETIPMHGRMIHGKSKSGDFYEESQEYDVYGRYIHAVDRAGLNARLLDALSTFDNVSFHFNHKLTGADFSRNLAWFEKRSHAPKTDHAQNPTEPSLNTAEAERAPEIEISFDLLIGADGAHSAARYHMMKFERLNYQQEYIDTLWCEFHIPAALPHASSPDPNSEKTFAISPNHLHIWPGGTFMFIAIPSLDSSFTCTLFAPHSTFKELSASPSATILPFFQKNFPGLCPELITEEDLLQQYNDNPHLPLISIKCTPYHHGSSVVIVGDAAHAMVPFYGQGMNAGLEDVRVLFDFLDVHGVYANSFSLSSASTRADLRAKALEAYTLHRTPDASAINDLALRNYEEMRSAVNSPLYILRKTVEEHVNKYLPGLGFATQYSRVSFENERYSEVERAVERQGRVLMRILTSGMMGVATGATVWTWMWWNGRVGKAGGSLIKSWFEWVTKRMGLGHP